MNIRKTFFACAFSFAFSLAFSATVPNHPDSMNVSWRVLENAQVAYDSAKYGEALNLANKAKASRKAEIEWESYILESALSPLAVRRVGDFFSDVLNILRERDENEAVAIIERYIRLNGESFYHNSVSELVSWVKAKAVYPEADFLIGKIYQLEGEFRTAYNFFEKARVEREFLEIPDMHYDILYAMVNLAREEGNFKNYEEALILILDSDANFKNKTFQNAFMRILTAPKSENADRFFLIFRADSKNSLEALYEYGNFRYKSGDLSGALMASALGSIEAFTHIYETICERDTSYSYTTYANFLEKCGKYDDIMEWCESNHVWELMFQMADRVRESGNTVLSDSFFEKIKSSMPDAYWQAEASSKLK